MRHAAVAVLILAACARPASPPPRDMVRTVAVLPPTNRTGDPLLVAGVSFLERYAFQTARVTVPDVLASEARVQLARLGFTVVPGDGVDATKAPALALHLDVRRWEPDAPTHPAFVIVALGAAFVDPATGRAVWTAERRAAPVATPGEVALGAAYVTAAQKVMEELLAPLGP